MRHNLKIHTQTFLHAEGTEIKCNCGIYSPSLLHTECLVQTAGKHVNEITKDDFDPEELPTINTCWECPCGKQHYTEIHPPTIEKPTIETTLNK